MESAALFVLLALHPFVLFELMLVANILAHLPSVEVILIILNKLSGRFPIMTTALSITIVIILVDFLLQDIIHIVKLVFLRTFVLHMRSKLFQRCGLSNFVGVVNILDRGVHLVLIMRILILQVVILVILLIIINGSVFTTHIILVNISIIALLVLIVIPFLEERLLVIRIVIILILTTSG